jgi:uncharacterized membrane protein
VNGAYIFKFFFQFIGALPIVAIYYLSREYVSDMIAYLAGFLYISFPTFMTDMAFLNRQGTAFLFFGVLLFVMFGTEYFSNRSRYTLLFLLGIGMVLSHYSTSYVAVTLFIIGYIINRVARFFFTATWPKWFARFTDRFKNKEIYQRQVLLSFPYIIFLLGTIILWSAVITKTASNVSDTLGQIWVNIQHPFSNEDHSGIDKYSLVKLQNASPQQRFTQFVKENTQTAQATETPKNLFPPSITKNYPTTLSSEPLVPLTSVGKNVQSTLHINLTSFYNQSKQTYATIMQVLLLIGLMGAGLGYSFRKNILRNIPAEYLSLSAAGIIIMAGQTILPSSAVDYGLLRLFQQNLILLTLLITLVPIAAISFLIRWSKAVLVICGIGMLAFFLVFSGFVPQVTGGGRALLPLNNYGFYYDAYYTHTQEIVSIAWMVKNTDPETTVQSDHYFSAVKVLSYSNIGTLIGLLPETTQRSSYVYLNYTNVKNQNVIAYIDGNVVYYHFPLNFLQDDKSLIYNNGGSEIYQ